MKKILIAAIVCVISLTTIAQKKQPIRSKQFSVSVGYNKASKKDFSNYANGELNGMALQLNYEKYWNNIGLGIDLAGMYNQQPTYNDAGLDNHIFLKSGPTFIKGTHYTTSTKATNLIRIFSGIGPNVKFNLSKKLQANIALRAGVTYTNGSGLEFGTLATPAFAWAGFLLNRNGTPSLAPGGSFNIQDYGTFYHEGYKNDLIGTGKAQLQLNYFIKPQLAIHLNGYYYGYMGSAARYNYIDWKLAETTSPIQNYWGNNAWGNAPGALNFGLSKLTSYGASIGITYQKGAANTSTKKATNKMAVAVKDELTGLPLSNVAVSIVSAEGKVYTANTDATGIANFDKIQDGAYKVSGTLNEVITNEQTATVGSNNRNTNVTLLHNDPRFTVQGKAINLSTTKPEGGVAVTLKNASKGSVKMGTSKDATGAFGFQIDANSDYELVGKKDSYISNIEKISTKGLL